jgi:hypothetical protein
MRGTIYDSYIRRILAEGILGKWANEIPDWLSCPAAPAKADSPWQTVLSGLRSLAGRAAPGEDTDDDVLCPFHWSKPIHQLNCDIIWPQALDEPPYKHISRVYAAEDNEHHGCGHDSEFFEEEEDLTDPRLVYLELDTPEYAGKIKDQMIIEKLLAQGGIRLAAVLNSLFADVDEGSGRVNVLNF